MAITFPASPSNGDVFTNATTGVKYIWNATDGVWKTQVFPTNTNYLQLSGGTLTGDLSLGSNDLTAQDINSTTLTTTGSVTVGNGLTVSDGNVVMASGHGIDFSATADGTGGSNISELLDDYEEGEFTPSLDFGGNAVGLTYSTLRKGVYTKIGRFVHCYVAMQIQNKGSSTGQVHLTGLPFTSSDLVGSTSYEGGGHTFYHGQVNGTIVGPITFAVVNNNQYCELLDLSTTSGGTYAGIDNSDVQSDFSFRAIITYPTSS
jgi:hypothetical protein